MISVIVPIYNAEKKLSRCLESILNQSYSDIEIILVNDGSEDNSKNICEIYSLKDARIVIINQENQGVSVARNNGILKAKGVYIVFVDADDWIDADFLVTMKNLITKEHADLIVTNYKIIYPNKTVYAERFSKNIISGQSLVPEELYDGEKFLLGNIPWNKLFKREILLKYSIFFKDDLKNGEDFIFVLEYGLSCKKILYLNEYSYNYDNSNEDSVTQKYFSDYYNNLKKTKDTFFEIVDRYRNVTSEEKSYHYFKVASKAIFEESKMNNKKNFFQRYIAIKNILNIPEIKDYRKKNKLEKRSDGHFFYFLKILMIYNQPFLITLFLTLYVKTNA